MEKTRNLFLIVRIIVGLIGLTLVFMKVPEHFALLPAILIIFEIIYGLANHKKTGKYFIITDYDERETKLFNDAANYTGVGVLLLIFMTKNYLEPAGIDWYCSLLMGFLLINAASTYFALNRNE
jgi:hypothetical protein